ncbi:MAG TPA: ABC transporter substrate-binding protein [Rectinemataceae bacterium]|nr:ABC transporter substrate-binding protein [Rectinemataceae bacterium]
MKKMRMVFALLALAAVCVSGVSAKGNEIKIAVAAPMTGDFAEYGTGFKNAVQLMADEWNDKGGILGKKIKVVVYDDKNNGEEGANVAEKIVSDDDIIAVIGHFASGVCLAAAPKYQEAGIPEISPSASHPDYSSVGDFIFRNNTVISVEAGAGIDIAMKTLNAKKIGILSVKTDWGTSTAAITKKLVADKGGKVYVHEEIVDGTVDFAPAITKMQNAGVDCVIVVAMYNVLAPFASQYKATTPGIKLVGFSNAYSEQLILLAKQNAEGIMFPAAFFHNSSEPHIQKFVTTYRAKYNMTPSSLTAQAYDSAGMVFEAIKAAGKVDRQAVRDQLYKITYPGVAGVTSFDANGDAQKIFTQVVIKNGKFAQYK